MISRYPSHQTSAYETHCHLPSILCVELCMSELPRVSAPVLWRFCFWVGPPRCSVAPHINVWAFTGFNSFSNCSTECCFRDLFFSLPWTTSRRHTASKGSNASRFGYFLSPLLLYSTSCCEVLQYSLQSVSLQASLPDKVICADGLRQGPSHL